MQKRPPSKTFQADIEGLGKFTFKYPTVMDELAIRGRYNDYLQGVSTANLYVEGLAAMMAHLKVTAVEHPPGWDPEECYDYEELYRAWAAYSEKALAFRKSLVESEEEGGGNART